MPTLRSGEGFSVSGLFGPKYTQDKLSFNNAIHNAGPAVVNIYSFSYDTRSVLYSRRPNERTSLGSGVVMTHSGHILTCLHVIQDADYIGVVLSDGQFYEAHQVGNDPLTDLAVLKINIENAPVIPQLEEPNTQVGDLVLAIGNPYNLGQTITQGIVGATGRAQINSNVAGYANFIQTDAVLNEGNSGGALVDSNGVLVGINNANYKTLDTQRRIKDVPGVFFAVPYKLAKKVMDQIISNGRVIRGYLGVSGNDLPGQQGFLITSITPRGPAALAGLQPNDVVLSVNGIQLEGAAHALELVAETTPGTTLSFKISRDDAVITIPVNIAELRNS
ncbi:trypsin-like peptidase domain-containing protein [Alteromonas sp. a30]|uniref:trypsin-like peptidase domain-containing protein n=1 Tax=Alteromonas sp. a30 TaxID=2730917 RepID=UPI002DDCD13D|nr:trypsin-like peptidase domain-containing protein [Alteromonas sp. a30]